MIKTIYGADLSLLLLIGSRGLALEPEEGALFCRVVDVGAGECCVIRLPGEDGDNHYIVYDAGNFADQGETAMAAVRELIPIDERINLLVLSHTDADHNAAVPDIVNEYFIDAVLRTGQDRESGETKTLKNARTAIGRAVEEDGTIDLNLSEVLMPGGATYRFGEALVTMICGFHAPLEDWDVRNRSERHNATSIVPRIQFQGKSILLCGDAVGRHSGSGTNAPPIATECYMLEQSSIISIDSDVIVAPHHGADNGSSVAFIAAVSPEWVIFPAGHKHEHPRATVAERYLNSGVEPEKIVRTDREDNEGGNEWPDPNAGDEPDGPGDDDVDILIRPDGEVVVEYRDQ